MKNLPYNTIIAVLPALCPGLALVAAAGDETSVIHAGELLAVPGEALPAEQISASYRTHTLS